MTEITTLGEPVRDPTEAALMQSEYQLLLNKLLNACNGTQPAVAIAASISAAFCVAVDVTAVEHQESAKRYLQSCIGDAFASIDKAFAAKAGESSGDTGKQSEGSNQEVVEG